MQLGLMVNCKYSLSAFHPAAPGSSPKHTIYAFTICSQSYAIFSTHCDKNENKQKEGHVGKNKNFVNFSRV